jgi:hypothetical protein
MSCPQVIKVITPGPPGIGLPAGTADAGKFLRKLGATPYLYELVTPDAIGLPQALGVDASPTFAGLTLSGLAANRLVFTGTGGLLTGISIGSGLAIVNGALTATAASGAVSLAMPTGFSVSGSGTSNLSVAFAAGYSLPTTTQQANWDTAYSDRLKWDGGAAGLDAPTARASLGLGTADSPTFAGLTITGTAPVVIPHIHASIAGDFYIHVKNTSGGVLPAGTAVYATGSVGDTERIEVAACDPTDPAKMPAIGLLQSSLNNNDDGDAVVLGELRPFNTGGFQLRDRLYVGAGGALVATPPASGLVQFVGSVARAQAETGTILVGIGAAMARVGFTGAYADLSGLPTIPSPADDVFVIPVGDESTALTTGTAKVSFRMPFAATLLAVRASVNTAPTGSTLIVDINEAGSSVLGTKLSIDASELTSTTAASAATITDSSLADDALVTIDIDQIGSTVAGAGLKVSLFVRRA